MDPDIAALINIMTIEEDPGFTKRFSDEYNCHITVTSKSGQQFSAEVSHPKGHWRNPLSDAEVEDKFRGLATEVLSPDQCRAALDVLWSIEEATNLSTLFDHLTVTV